MQGRALTPDVILSGNLSVSKTVNLQNKVIYNNGQYEADEGYDGLGKVTVDVHNEMTDLKVTENGVYLPPEGYDGFDSVDVNVPERVPVIESKSITENGTYTAPTGVDGYSPITVNVPLPANAYLLKELSNLPQPIATFNDGTANPLKSLTVSIEPVQAGSGDPSPTNVRPISGWSACNIYDNGVNLFTNVYASTNISLNNGVDYTDTDMDTMLGNNKTNAPNNILTTLVGAYLKAGTYTIKNFTDGIYCSILRIALAGDVCKYSPQHIREDGYTFTTTKDGWSWFLIDRDTGYDVYTDTNFDGTPLQFQIEKGSSPTTYHAYNGSTITIQLGDTYYWCKFDVVSGLLTVLGVLVDMGTLSWSKQGEGFFFANNLEGLKIAGDALSSMFKIEHYYPTMLSNNSTLWISDTRNQIMAHLDGYTATADFKTAVTGQQLVYELATPTTFYTQPTSIKSHDGENNVSANTGDVTDLEFFTQVQ